MLLNRELSASSGDKGKEEDSYILNLRHYAITTKRVGVSRRIRRLDPREQRHKEKKERTVPNLGKLNDVADYLLDPAAGGYTSASDTEMDTDAEVEVMESTTKKVLNKRDLQRVKEGEKKLNRSSSSVEKRAVKLVELGPRMKLKLMKVEEGLCGGKVMWHHFISKTQLEADQLDKTWEERRREKELRRKIQKENVEKKKKAKRGTADGGDEDEQMVDDEDTDEWDSEDYDDEEVEADDEMHE
jgi:ribosome biogenesis protein SSF1/2